MLNLKAIQSMSYDEYAHELEHFCNQYKHILSDLISGETHEKGRLGHSIQRHVGLTVDQMLERNIREKNNVSSFYNKAELDNTLNKAIIKNKDEISHKILNGERVKLKFKADREIGNGVDVLYEGVTCQDSVFIIDPSTDRNTTSGIVLISAYPDIDGTGTKSTGINYITRAQKDMNFLERKQDFLYRSMRDTDYEKNQIHIVRNGNLALIDELSNHQKLTTVFNIITNQLSFTLINNEWKIDFNMDDIENGKYVFSNKDQEVIDGIQIGLEDAYNEFMEQDEILFMEDYIDQNEIDLDFQDDFDLR